MQGADAVSLLPLLLTEIEEMKMRHFGVLSLDPSVQATAWRNIAAQLACLWDSKPSEERSILRAEIDVARAEADVADAKVSGDAGEKT